MMSENNYGINNNNLPSTATAATVIPPGSDVRENTANGKPRGRTAEQNIALLEDAGICGAHIPTPRQTRKCWENVVVALKSRGNTYDNYQTIQHHFLDLKSKFVAEWARRSYSWHGRFWVPFVS
jgi:hypothetical protein